MVGAYRRMIRELAFDICEMAPVTYLIARDVGIPITALPVFLMRRFHHADLECRIGSGIEQPWQLEGRKVGVRAYSVTTGVWVRGLLQQQYGVDLNAVTWVTDDDEHVDSLKLPENVVRLPAGESIAETFMAGGLDAALGGNAGTGRAGAPVGDWTRRGLSGEKAYPLLSEPDQAARGWYEATSIYPLHSVVCVRTSVLERYPGAAGALIEAFAASKAEFLTALRTAQALGDEWLAEDLTHYRSMCTIVGADPLPFGIADNEASIEGLIVFARQQGLISAPCAAHELFHT
jgi:4,5-dihydroxyphthalate decarboxylase